MSPELKTKISEDLETTGFGSEMRAAQIALQSGWNCQPGDSYLDYHENKTREIDLSIGKSKWLGGGAYSEYHIKVEVKKSERPWIALTKDKGALDHDAWSNPSAFSHLPFEASALAGDLRATSYLHKLSWVGYGVHELGKKPNQPSGWYAAAIGASKACAHAAAHFYDRDNLPHPDHDEDRPNTIMEGTGETALVITQPVVVLEGTLARAWIDDSAQIQVEEADIVPLKLHLRTKGHLLESFRVDLVRLESLSMYLEHQDKRIDHLSNRVRASLP